MHAAPSAVEVHRPVAEEEAARADFYALLGALFARPPDERLLRSLALAAPLDGGDQELARAWSDLIAASAVMDPEAAAEEFEALFVGVGRAKVSCYAGFYQAGATAVDHPRVRIIADLAALGLGRPAGVTDPEDHYAGLFDVMRILVMGGGGAAAGQPGRAEAFLRGARQARRGQVFRGRPCGPGIELLWQGRSRRRSLRRHRKRVVQPGLKQQFLENEEA